MCWWASLIHTSENKCSNVYSTGKYGRYKKRACVCVCVNVHLCEIERPDHARCCNPLWNPQNLLCANVSVKSCMCLKVVLSTRWPSETDGVWLHAFVRGWERARASHLWASWHRSQPRHGPTRQNCPPDTPSPLLLYPSCFQLGVITSKWNREDYRSPVPRGVPGKTRLPLSLTVEHIHPFPFPPLSLGAPVIPVMSGVRGACHWKPIRAHIIQLYASWVENRKTYLNFFLCLQWSFFPPF